MEKSKFADPYLREDLNDFGIWIDTLSHHHGVGGNGGSADGKASG